jgi:hypothetical protein
VRQKLIVEYDENGEIIDSDNNDDDEPEKDNQVQTNNMEERYHEPQQPQQHTNNALSLTNSKSISKKIKNSTQHPFRNGITTKDVISFAMNQIRISESTKKLQQSTSSITPQPTMASPISLASSSLSPAKIPPLLKTDQDIRGYELWSHEDDMILLNHVLYHLHGGGWADLEVKFEGRHSARLCYDRWKHLRGLLITGITDKPNTPW